ncbi:hypothetical protein [uncultured Methanobacterium sp.]|uniref:hypothetical protein n=1 Tax=uncultured Methanobacterium sp. TaxID=176306 RepID=UPI002AA79D5F|nr:hypothetical protein [uncultured Methanobacterium sp.]
MVLNKVKFEDIVNELKEAPEMNIYKLIHNLKCSKSLLYSRITENGFNGLKDLKISILKGEI